MPNLRWVSRSVPRDGPPFPNAAGVPVIVIGARPEIGAAALNALDGRPGGNRAFVPDPGRARALPPAGMKWPWATPVMPPPSPGRRTVASRWCCGRKQPGTAGSGRSSVTPVRCSGAGPRRRGKPGHSERSGWMTAARLPSVISRATPARDHPYRRHRARRERRRWRGGPPRRSGRLVSSHFLPRNPPPGLPRLRRNRPRPPPSATRSVWPSRTGPSTCGHGRRDPARCHGPRRDRERVPRPEPGRRQDAPETPHLDPPRPPRRRSPPGARPTAGPDRLALRELRGGSVRSPTSTASPPATPIAGSDRPGVDRAHTPSVVIPGSQSRNRNRCRSATAVRHSSSGTRSVVTATRAGVAATSTGIPAERSHTSRARAERS